MATKTKLEFNYPPSVNHYWFRNGNQYFIGKEGKRYREHVYWHANQQKAKKTCGKISLTIDVFPPDRRRRDLDNLPKCVLDSLVHANIIDDDSNIDALHIIRQEMQKPAGKIIVTIAPL